MQYLGYTIKMPIEIYVPSISLRLALYRLTMLMYANNRNLNTKSAIFVHRFSDPLLSMCLLVSTELTCRSMSLNYIKY